MYLVTTATEYELQPFLAACRDDGYSHLLSGVGPLETAVRLSSWLHAHVGHVTAVVNFGVAGAYTYPGSRGPELLDICVAEREVLGDLGICFQDRIERLSGKNLTMPDTFSMDPVLLDRTRKILNDEQVPFYSGTFVTVNCASGTAGRGAILAGMHGGLCENMEGAAVARVCSAFNLPCLEIRCISNMVEDRDTGRWQLQKACGRAARVTASVVRRLIGRTEESSVKGET